METCFVTRPDDRLGVSAVEQLSGMGVRARVLESSEIAASTDVALFTAPEGAKFRRRYLSVSPHKFEERGIPVPGWARATPFRAAIRGDGQTIYRYSFRHALEQLARSYGSWNPWTRPLAPWKPAWKSAEPPEAFSAWHAHARTLVAPPTLEARMARYLRPAFPSGPVSPRSTLMVIGCAAFNRPHTDLVDALLPSKMEAVVEYLAEMADVCGFERVEVVVPERDILDHELFRSHLHPFIFASVEEAERQLGKPFAEPTRLWGRTHRRSLAEIGDAFQASAAAMDRQLVEPLSGRIGVPVERISWSGLIRPYLEEAAGIVERHQALIEAIYLERVKTRPSYAMLHGIDPVAGIARTRGNAVLYVAEAMHLRDRPDCVIANFEANDTYWKGLETVVRPLWSERVPYIGMVEEAHRQPWGY